MHTKQSYSKETLKRLILCTFKNDMLIDPENASDEAYYEALCRVTREILGERLQIFSAHSNARAAKKYTISAWNF